MTERSAKEGRESRLLIIGSRGFLGEHLALVASRALNVVRGETIVPVSESTAPINVTDASSIREAFEQVRPDVVALLAAISDIDRCERERELAEAVNWRGAETVARECARSGARLIFTSSAAVFDGSKGHYSEEDAPTPLSWYGETKARAEAAILETMPNAAIVRITLAIGYSRRGGTNSMLDKLRDDLYAGKTVAAPVYEYRNPIDATTLAQFMFDLATIPTANGIFHTGATDAMSRYDLMSLLASRMGYSSELIVPQAEPIPGRAPRGLNHFLLSGKIAKTCGRPIPNCEQAIESALNAAP